MLVGPRCNLLDEYTADQRYGSPDSYGGGTRCCLEMTFATFEIKLVDDPAEHQQRSRVS